MCLAYRRPADVPQRGFTCTCYIVRVHVYASNCYEAHVAVVRRSLQSLLDTRSGIGVAVRGVHAT